MALFRTLREASARALDLYCTHLFEKTSNVREVKVCSRLDLSCSAGVFGGVSCYCNGCTGGGTGGGGVGAAESDG